MAIQWWLRLIAVIWLGGLGLVDLRKKEIPLWPLLPMVVIGLGLRLGGRAIQETPLFSISGSAPLSLSGMDHVSLSGMDQLLMLGADLLPGLAAWMINRFRRQALGEGDVWLLCGLGLVLGWRDVCTVLFMATLLSAIIGSIGLLCRKLKPDSTLPFVPFLFLAALPLWLGLWV